MSDTESAERAETQERFTRRQVLLIFGGLLLAMLTAALNQTIVSTALPTIVGELGGLDQLSWVVTAYLLASTVSTPLWGKLGDLYGRKPLFQVSIGIFLVGSVLSGISQDMAGLVAFRALQGLGGGGLIVGAQTIVGDVVPPRNLGRYQGIFGAAFGVAIFGAIFSAQLAQNLPSDAPAGSADGVQADPSQLQQLPAAVLEGYVEAFATSLDAVFLAAVPFALFAFVLTWILDEMPLRKTVETSGVGESYAMPKDDSSLREIERALTILASRDSSRRIYERLALRAGVDLAPAEAWLLLRLDEHAPATPTDLASRLDVAEDRLLPHLERLQRAGLAAGTRDERDGGGLRIHVSPRGRSIVEKLVMARQRGLGEWLEGWSPEQHEEVARLLKRLARELIRDYPEPGFDGAAAPSPR